LQRNQTPAMMSSPAVNLPLQSIHDKLIAASVDDAQEQTAYHHRHWCSCQLWTILFSVGGKISDHAQGSLKVGAPTGMIMNSENQSGYPHAPRH